MPYLQIEIHVLHPSPSAESRAKAICCRIFTPAQPERPAASVRDYCSGAYKNTELSGMTTRKFCASGHRKTRTGLSQSSNRSLFAAPILVGKRFGEARDRAGIFGDDCYF